MSYAGKKVIITIMVNMVDLMESKRICFILNTIVSTLEIIQNIKNLLLS